MNSNTGHKNGFSLIELMAVLAIVSILLALTVPATNGLIRSLDLNSTGESVYGVFHTARQAARAKNQPVEIRFYREGNDGAVVAVEAYAQNNDGMYEQVAAHTFAEGRGIITLDSEKTSLLSGEFRQDPNSSRPDPKSYQLFRFRPDGSTELAETEKWFLTLLYNEESDQNYFTILVNPVSGSLKTYRP